MRTVPRAIAGVPLSNPYGLGALDPVDAAKQIFPNAPRSPNPGHNMDTFNAIVASAQAGQMVNAQGAPAYIPGTSQCAGVSLLKPALFSTSGGLTLHFAPMAFAAGGPLIGGIVVAIGALAEMFGAIFSHHAKAIAKERSILCAAVPAANQALQLIDQAVQQGSASPQDAIAALDTMPGQFQSQVSSIIHGADPTVSGECNAACVMLSELRAIVLVKKAQYQDMVSAASSSLPGAGAVTSAVSQAAAASGVPSWLWWAAGAWLAYELVQ